MVDPSKFRIPKGARFDLEKAKRVKRFFEKILKHPRESKRVRDPHTGGWKIERAPFLLLDWQIEFLYQIFGIVNAETGIRMYKRAYLEIAKKNGKSELAAGIALWMLIADKTPACEIYSAATVKKQAAIVFNTAAAMVLASPILRSMLKVIRSAKRIVKRSDPDSFYQVIAADGDAEDGINPTCVIIDELHRWKTGKALELFEVLTKGTIAREEPLIIEITTAGSTEDESPLAAREHEYVRNMEEGTFEDVHFFGKIYSADPKDDWTLVSTWEKANPSLSTLGGFLKLAALEDEYNKARNSPRTQAAFKRFHLGIWLSTETEWMPIETWDENAEELRPTIERTCYAGLDLSSTTDLTSLVLIFPDSFDESYDVMAFFWMAADRVRERELADRMPYSQWVHDGLIEATEGDVIDLRDIKAKILWAAEVFDLQAVAFDPHHAGQLAIELADQDGIACVPVPQRFSHLSEPMKKVETWALQKKFRHAGNAVLRWNMRCMRVKSDGADNIKPVKPDRFTSSKRIDGAVALILAASRAMFHKGSVYETRGLLTK